MTERLYHFVLTGKEPSILLNTLVDARDNAEKEYAETGSEKTLYEWKDHKKSIPPDCGGVNLGVDELKIIEEP